jgi:multiple sugar transport system permease protein
MPRTFNRSWLVPAGVLLVLAFFDNAFAIFLFMGETAGQWNLLMAATVMVLIPVLLVFFFLQRYFVRGAAMTGLKG